MEKKFYFLEGDFVCCAKLETQPEGKILRLFFNEAVAFSEVTAYLVSQGGAFEEAKADAQDKNVFATGRLSGAFDAIVLAATYLAGERLFARSGEKDDDTFVSSFVDRLKNPATAPEVPDYMVPGPDAAPLLLPFTDNFRDYGFSFAPRSFENIDMGAFPYNFLFLSKPAVSSVVRKGGFYEGQKGSLKVIAFLFEPGADEFPLLHIAPRCFVKLGETDKQKALCLVGADLERQKIVPVSFR